MRGASCASNDENESNFLEREEVFCCEETLREKREKKRGEETERRWKRETFCFFSLFCLFFWGQSDFFWGVHSPKNIITHFDETFAQYEQLSLSLYSKEHLSVIFSSSQRVIIVLLFI